MSRTWFSFLIAAVVLGSPLSADDPLALMLQARALQRRSGGDEPEKAVALYRRVIEHLPTSAEAHLRLSEALAESGDLESALPPAVKATELAPRHAEAWANLGILYFFKGRTDPDTLDKALVALQKASYLLPKDIDILVRLGEVSEVRKQDQVAMDTWLRVGRLRPMATLQGRSLTDIAYERAAILASKIGHMEGRREALLALCSRSQPEDLHLRMLEELAREQIERSYLAYAEESFRILSRFRPDEAPALENIALIQLRTYRFDEALPTLETLSRLRKTPRASYYTAVCLMNLGRFKEAEARMRDFLDTEAPKLKAARDLPNRAKAMDELVSNAQELLGATLILTQRPGELLSWMATLPAEAITDGLLTLQAQALIQTQAWRKARAVLKEGMKRYPDRRIFALAALVPQAILEARVFKGKDNQRALTQLDLECMAGLWAEFRQWERALEALKAARNAAPVRGVDLLLLQSSALEQLGRPEEAMAVLREAQRLAPDNPNMQNNLGYMLLERNGDLNEAATLIKAALDKDPKSGSTMDSWGWVLFKQGKLADAEKALRDAVELSPLSPEIRRHFGEVLLKLGRHEEALEQWERALAYVFPGRQELEKQTKTLRLEVAKRRTQPVDTQTEPASDEPQEDGEEDEL